MKSATNINTMLLAVQYMISVESLAGRLGVSLFEAHEMLAQHRSQFSQYWAWSDDWVQHSLADRHDANGLRLDLSHRHHRVQRTLYLPIGQSKRRAPTFCASPASWPYGTASSCLAPIHDAVLIEAPADRIDADVAVMREIMRRASRIVLNADRDGTHELRTDATIVRYPDRYSDKRGAEIWEPSLRKLAELQKTKEAACA